MACAPVFNTGVYINAGKTDSGADCSG
jgi:hypothetical protein